MTTGVLAVCPVSGCGALTAGGRCAAHRRADDARRHAKQRAHGRDRRGWRAKVAAAKQRCGFRCQVCGRLEDRAVPGLRLSGHLPARFAGDHDAASSEDVVVAHASCHGSIDAPRANGGVVSSAGALCPPRITHLRESSTTLDHGVRVVL